MMKVVNKQYDNVCLETSNKLRINSVVLLKNIANETKREPLRLARIEEIKELRDDTQRVVVVTYHNIGLNKKDEWIGNPVTVERCVCDVVLVDNDLNESMLDPKLHTKNMRANSDNQSTGNHIDEAQEVQRINDKEHK